MKQKIRLFSSHRNDTTKIPQWWENFLDSLDADYRYAAAPTWASYHLNDHWKINEKLKPFNARFRTTIKRSPYGIRYVTFDSEEDMLLFVLRWSS